MKKYLALTVLFVLSASLCQAAGSTAAPATNAPSALPRVQIITSMGEIVVELDPAAAPKTVENFLAYAKSGFYDGTLFHRVIPGFMIQGGGFEAGLKEKTTLRPPVQNEADNKLLNRTGTIAMARTSDPHSASAQFFINVRDNNFLDHRDKTEKGWGYCVFGKVVSGMEVVRQIEQVPTGVRYGMNDVPRTAVIIQKVSVMAAGGEKPEK